MTFRRIDSYATDNPEKLADQLSRLEDNITKALAEREARLVFKDWELVEPYFQLSYGAISRFNTDAATAAVPAVLPSISPNTIGQFVGIKRVGGQNIELFPVEDDATVDGLANATLIADGLYLYTHDGESWSRV